MGRVLDRRRAKILAMLNALRADRHLLIILFISIAATILGFAAVVGIAYSKGLDPISLTGDSKGYIILAQNLAEHHVFSVSQSAPFAPESFRAPGYPLFLAMLFALFGASVFALFVHALITGIAPVLLFMLTRSLHERAAFWASALFAFEPVRLFLSASFLSDALFAVLFLASLVALEWGRERLSYGWLAAVGLLLGLMILVRPIAIFLPIVYAGYVALRMRPFAIAVRHVALMCALVLVVVFPWMYRNHALFGSWNVSSVGNANLMLYNAPEFLKWHPDSRAQEILNVFNAEQVSLPREDAISLTRSEVFTSTFREIIRGNELSYVFFHIVKSIPFFVTDGLRDTIRLLHVDIGSMPNISTALMRGDVGTLFGYLLSGGLPIALLVIGSGFWGIVTLLFASESIRALIRRDVFPLFLALLVCYFAFLTGPVSNARYRVPVEGLMVALAIVVGHRWYDSRNVAAQ